MIQSEEGKRLHKLAEDARESGNFADALKYTDEAMLAYQKGKDYLGLSEVQASRQNTFEHLFRATHDSAYLLLQRHAAQAAVEIAEMSGIKEALGIPYHNLAKYYSEVGEYAQAAKYFRQAVECLERFPNPSQSRPSVIADIRGHLYAVEYKAGDKNALERALQALADLELAEEPSTYNKNVWLSGAHIRIADMLKEDNPEMSRTHYDAAKKIVDSDSRLILRREQLKALEKAIQKT